MSIQVNEKAVMFRFAYYFQMNINDVNTILQFESDTGFFVDMEYNKSTDDESGWLCLPVYM